MRLGGAGMAGLTISVTIPMLPSALQYNRAAGRHWGSTSGLRAKVRYDARMAALDARNRAEMEKPFDCATVQATFYFNKKRRIDPDSLNTWLKHSFDGLQGVLIVNDRNLTPLPAIVKIDRDSRIVLEVVQQ
jgi:hypothetical protein